MDHFRPHHSQYHQQIDQLKQLGRSQPPAIDRLTRKTHSIATGDRFVALMRDVIGCFGDHDIRKQTRTGKAAGDQLGRLGRSHHVLFG
jgi:hypothetical protein